MCRESNNGRADGIPFFLADMIISSLRSSVCGTHRRKTTYPRRSLRIRLPTVYVRFRGEEPQKEAEISGSRDGRASATNNIIPVEEELGCYQNSQH